MSEKKQSVRLEGLTKGERVAINYALAQWRPEVADLFQCRNLVRLFGGDPSTFPERETMKLSGKLHDKLKEILKARTQWPTNLATAGGQIELVMVQLKEGEGGAIELLQRFGLLPTAEDLNEGETPAEATP